MDGHGSRKDHVTLHNHSFAFLERSHAAVSERCRPGSQITDLQILGGLIPIALLWKSCPCWNKAAFGTADLMMSKAPFLSAAHQQDGHPVPTDSRCSSIKTFSNGCLTDESIPDC
jgi:hypothetical protein